MIGHRTLKRVPLNFDWPIGQVWPGYLGSGKHREPPIGPGYQLWETTSEGSPMSPVFAKLEDLANWCAKNATLFGSKKISTAEWEKLFSRGGNLEEASLGMLTSDDEIQTKRPKRGKQ